MLQYSDVRNGDLMNYKVITTIDELPTFNPDLPIFCDCESDGLYVNTRLIQYYQPETAEEVYVLDVDYFGEHTTDAGTQNSLFKALGKTKEVKVTSKEVEELHSKLWLVWWNGSYDQGLLKFGSKKVDDLIYMARIGLPKLDAYNLDRVVDYLFPGRDFYKGLDKSTLQKAGFKPGMLSDEQIKYAATDVYVMKLMWDKLYPKLKDNRAYQVDALNLGYTVRWQQTGLKVDRAKRDAEEVDYKLQLIETHAKFPVDVNVNSYQQVRALLAANDEGWDTSTEYAWEQVKAKHKANPIVTESDETALLTRAANGCPYSTLILKERSVTKTLTFLRSFDRDKVYGHFNPYGTRTGRWACKGGKHFKPEAVNMQQLPRKLKHIFGFEESDPRIFVGGDLPTAELRLIAAVYGEKTMAEAFANKIDLHTLTASNTTGKAIEEITGDERKKAKAENFGLCYGMGAKTFQGYAFKNYEIVMTIEEAEERVNNWLRAYPDQSATINRIKKEFFANNPVVKTLLNRWVLPEMYTDAVNIPIQGGIAEVAKLWIHYIVKLNEADKNYELKIANFVHDSVSLECLESEADYWQNILVKACDKAWSYYMSLPGIKIPTVDMPVEVGISKHYQGVS